jgi:hypothetical protein
VRAVAVIALAAGALAVAVSARAGAPFDGRWASEAGACSSENEAAPVLVVSPFLLRWRAAACVIGRSYLVGDAWNIGARCVADGATANVPIKLEVRGERLLLDWAGAPTQELRRCP